MHIKLKNIETFIVNKLNSLNFIELMPMNMEIFIGIQIFIIFIIIANEYNNFSLSVTTNLVRNTATF